MNEEKLGYTPDDPPFINGFINTEKYEIIPEETPPDETPRQFVLRMTDKDMPELTSDGRDLTWKEIDDAGALDLISRILQLAYKPRIRLRKREP